MRNLALALLLPLAGQGNGKAMALLPRADREAWWQQQLQHGAATHLGHFASQMLTGCPAGETLSQPLSLALASLLRERAQAIGAQLMIDSRPGQTVVTIVLPVR